MTSVRVLAFGLVLMLSSFTTGAATISPAKAFEKMQSLVGDWEAKTEKGSFIHINYRLVSAESVLVQTFTTSSGRQTLTVFHMDGSSLMATHYCAQGNQPRLRLESSSTESALAFLFVDATNLGDTRASHMRRMQIDITDPDHFTETNTYSSDGKDDTEVMTYMRYH